MQNRMRQGIAISCGVAQIEKDERVDSDGRTGWRDYSCQCKDAADIQGFPQGRELSFVTCIIIRVCEKSEKAAMQ